MAKPTVELTADNPFLDQSSLPYGAPPFDLLKPEIFLPAVDLVRSQTELAIKKITKSHHKPTFKNTIEAYELSGAAIDRLRGIYWTVAVSNNNEDIRSLGQQFNSGVRMNEQKLFARIKKVYDARNALNLNPVERTLLERTYRDFVRDGALLSKEDRLALNMTVSALNQLSSAYQRNMNASMAAYQKVIDDEADLAGVPERAKAFYQQQAEEAGLSGKWLIRLSPPPLDIAEYCDNRALREEISNARANIACEGEYDNRDIVLQIVRLRHKRAQLLGYDNYASYVLDDRMMGNTENAMGFLEKSKEVNSVAAEEHLQKVRDFAEKTDGITDLKRWDLAYYERKLQEQTFAIELEDLRPYFEFNNVLEGLRKHVEKLFSVELTETKGKYPVYDPDVKVFEVKNKSNGEMIGLFYGDYFARPGLKKTGAWSRTVSERDMTGGSGLAAAHNLCNFPRPTAEQPTLLSPDDVETVFHEFGHAIHSLLSQVKYNSLAGSNVTWDFVEMPSQLQENWVTEKEVLNTFAVHYKTGQPLSDELIEKIGAMKSFGAGYTDLMQTYTGMLDMKWHMTDPATLTTVEDFENALKKEIPTLLLGDNLMSTRIEHVFSGGYAAGYYGYAWTKALGKAVFETFKEKGLYDPETAKALRDIIYAKGATENAVDLFTEMTGHKPDPEALFRSEGEQMTKKKTQQPVPAKSSCPAPRGVAL